jgi:tetratricopeptide (TPR) repeat protein
MSAIDRQAAMRTAEKALRQGRVADAIAAYLRIVEADPADWNTANALGDLYVRDRQLDKGIAQFTHCADHLAAEGFHAKASALYKKILKMKPDDEYALVQSGEMAARLGLLADARQAFREAVARRRSQGDDAGAAAMQVRLEALDLEERVVPPV